MSTLAWQLRKLRKDHVRNMPMKAHTKWMRWKKEIGEAYKI